MRTVMSMYKDRARKRDKFGLLFKKKKDEFLPKVPEAPRRDVKSTTLSSSAPIISPGQSIECLKGSISNIKAARPDVWALAFEALRNKNPSLIESFEFCLGINGEDNKKGIVQTMANHLAHEGFLKIKTFNESKEALHGRTANVRKSFEQILKIITAGKDAISAVAAVNPYAAAAWTGVCFVLPVGNLTDEVFLSTNLPQLLLSPTQENGAAIEGLDCIIHLMTIYKWQENIYLSKDPRMDLIDSMKNLYVKILEYEATLLIHVHQNPPKRWVRDVFKAGDWLDRMKDIQKLDSRCRELTNAIAARRTQQWKEEEQQWQSDLLEQPREERQKYQELVLEL